MSIQEWYIYLHASAGDFNRKQLISIKSNSGTNPLSTSFLRLFKHDKTVAVLPVPNRREGERD